MQISMSRFIGTFLLSLKKATSHYRNNTWKIGLQYLLYSINVN